jgi:hypothetical protein
MLAFHKKSIENAENLENFINLKSYNSNVFGRITEENTSKKIEIACLWEVENGDK